MPQKLIQTNNPDRNLVGSRETNQIKNQCILSRLAWVGLEGTWSKSARLSGCLLNLLSCPHRSALIRRKAHMRCTVAWHAEQSAIRFCSESSPGWLRNS